MTLKRCTKCGVEKALSAFFRGAGYKDGIRSRCKSCCMSADDAREKAKRRRRCSKCGETKAGAEFGRTKSVTSWCLQCRRIAARKWRAEHPDAWRGEMARKKQDPKQLARMKEYERMYRLFARFGLTADDYDRMFDAQQGVCAICKQPPNKANTRSGVLHVDHDHATGKIRGLLCALCNTMLGCAKDDVRRLEAARAYLLAV